MKQIVLRIEFWIVLFFLIRLTGITNPPLEIGHNWRQVTGLMVSRNFLEVDKTILYPRVDDNQGKSGIIGMEFPLMNYLHFAMAEIFGYAHWYGRLLNLIISSIGIFFFHRLVRKYFESQTALYASLILLCSIWFSFSRKAMPDTACISLIFAALYYGLAYLEEGKLKHLLLYAFLATAAILIKIPAGIYLPLFLFPLYFGSGRKSEKVIWAIGTTFILSLVYSWYFVWNPYLSEIYGNWYNSGKPFWTGFYEIIGNLDQVSQKFYFAAFHSYVFLGCFITGIWFCFKKRNKKIIYSAAVVTAAFLIYMFKSGFYFYHHDYYIIPYVPVMALVAGFFVSQINNKWLFGAVISFGIFEGIANQQHDFFIKNSEKYKLNLETIADSISEKRNLIAINGNNNPQQLYLTHRKGWNCNDTSFQDTKFIRDLNLQGCRFVFINKHTYHGDISGKRVYSDADFDVYRLDSVVAH